LEYIIGKIFIKINFMKIVLLNYLAPTSGGDGKMKKWPLADPPPGFPGEKIYSHKICV
jgi:hypothetical protein